jgi:integrase
MSGKLLTAAAVRKFAPAAKRRRIPDAGMRSLFLIVEPSGHKSWQMRFRVGGGRVGKMTLGAVALDASSELQQEPAIGQPLTLSAARQLAARVHRERALGHDPVAEHKAVKERQRAAVVQATGNAFGAVAKEFVEQYARKKVRRWKEQARLLGWQPNANGGLDIIPGGLAQLWGDKPVGEIDGHNIHTLVAETRERGAPGLERRSDHPTESRARAMLAVLSRMYRWLLQHRRVEVNPCISVHRPEPPMSRERVLSGDEIRWFWGACAAVGEPFGPIFRLLLLLGQRLNEVAGMRREELHEDNTWRLPGSRTKNRKAHIVPLSNAAQAIIAAVPNVHEIIFSTTGRSPPSGWSRAKHRLDQEMLKLAQQERGAVATILPFRLHDLRRTCVTGMGELGIRPDVIELCVNHISGHRGGIAGVYNKSELLAERKAALERWAAHIEGVVSRRAANVVALRG